ncbi:hypothetical protein OC844_002418 [Tilletia horrida]|nr:hypothetical protein OC844_002418 [Tilletia horrida]
MPSMRDADAGSLEGAGICSSEQLIKALKAPSDPPPGLKLSKIQIAQLAAQDTDGLAIPDRHALLADWILQLMTQSAKAQPKSAKGTGKVATSAVDKAHWSLLDLILSTKLTQATEGATIKKLASQHPFVLVLTTFALRQSVTKTELALCSRVVARLFATSAVKSSTNNIDQINKCIEACLAAVPSWLQCDVPATYTILSEVHSCWRLACVHSVNLKKASKFFLSAVYDHWTIAVQSTGLALCSATLRDLIIDFGITALLYDEMLQSHCLAAADLLQDSAEDRSDNTSAELLNRVRQSLQASSSQVRQGSMNALPILLAELVARLGASWPTLAPEKTVVTVSGTLEQQLYIACLHSVVRRRFLEPVFTVLRELSPSTETAAREHSTATARTRKALLQQVLDSGMFSTATPDETVWRFTFATLLDDILEDIRTAPEDGFSSLGLLWQLDTTGMEDRSTQTLSLVAQLRTTDSASGGFAPARALINHVAEHFSRIMEIPRLCTVLWDAAEAASAVTTVTEPITSLARRGALWSEGCVADWGRKIQGFLVPSQVATVVDNFHRRGQEHCRKLQSYLLQPHTDTMEQSSSKRRRTSKDPASRQESYSTAGRSLDVPLQAAAFFSASALIFQYLPHQGVTAATLTPVLSQSVSGDLHPTLAKALHASGTQNASQAHLSGAVAAAILHSLTSLSTYIEALEVPAGQAAAGLAEFDERDGVDDFESYPAELQLSLFSKVEKSRPNFVYEPCGPDAPEVQQKLLAMIVRSVATDSDVLLQRAVCRAIVSRWIPLLERVLTFPRLVDFSERALSIAAQDKELLSNLIGDTRGVEASSFTAAVCKALLLQVERLAQLDGEELETSLAVVERFEFSALPIRVRTMMLQSILQADIRAGKPSASDAARDRIALTLRTVIGKCTRLSIDDDILRTQIEWLSSLKLDRLETSSSAIKAATLGAVVATSASLLTRGDAQIGETLLPFIARATALHLMSKRIARNVALLLAESGNVGSHKTQLATHCKAATDAFDLSSLDNEATSDFNEEALLRIIDTLQALRLSRLLSSPDGPKSEDAALDFGEKVIRHLARCAEGIASSDVLAAVAIETLRLGWSLSSGVQSSAQSSRLAQWTAVLLAMPALADRSSALRSEVAIRIREHLDVVQYETSLVALEQFVDQLLSVPTIPGSDAVLLRVSEANAIVDLCIRLVAPSAAEFAAVTTDMSATIYKAIVTTMTTLIRQRPDLLTGMMPSLTAIICQLFVLLRRIPAGSGAALMASSHAGTSPAWLDLSQSSLGPTEADLLSRLLLSITAKTSSLPILSRQKKNAAGEPISATSTTSLAGPFAKHAIHVLTAYCRMLNSPLLTTDPNVRRALQPGLFALCDIVKTHERDAAMVASLGAAEQVVFKDLWSRWEKQRYRGE